MVTLSTRVRCGELGSAETIEMLRLIEVMPRARPLPAQVVGSLVLTLGVAMLTRRQ